MGLLLTDFVSSVVPPFCLPYTSIPPATTQATAVGLFSGTFPLNLAILMDTTVNQLVERLMEGAMQVVYKCKWVDQVSLTMLYFVKLHFKVPAVLVEELILDSCPDKALLTKQFASN